MTHDTLFTTIYMLSIQLTTLSIHYSLFTKATDYIRYERVQRVQRDTTKEIALVVKIIQRI